MPRCSLRARSLGSASRGPEALWKARARCSRGRREKALGVLLSFFCDAIRYVRDNYVEEEKASDEMRARERRKSCAASNSLDENVVILLCAPFSMAATRLNKIPTYLVVVKSNLDYFYFNRLLLLEHRCDKRQRAREAPKRFPSSVLVSQLDLVL